MDSTPNTGKTLATKLKGNLWKLVFTVILLSIAVIAIAVAITTDFKAKTNTFDSGKIVSASAITDPSTTNLTIKTNEEKPSTTNATRHPNLKAGIGNVVVDQDELGFSTESDGFDGDLLEKLETTSKYWFDQAQMTLKDRLYKKPNTNVAKNIVYFLGDGMSLTTITAARIFKGQLKGKKGEEEDLWFQTFPHVALAKTYCLNLQVADSACAATAYLSGVKANMFTQGVNGQVLMNDCKASRNPQNHVYSLLRWAQLAGKSTGVVTNTRVTHATPAVAYGHSSNRLHESDFDVHNLGGDRNDCIDLARQLIESETGRNLNVIMGGGSVKMLPNTTIDDHGKHGERLDGRNLINEWISSKKNQSVTWTVVSNRESLMKVNYSHVDNLLGLFASQHMKYHSDTNHTVEPTLTEMTEMAMNVLSTNSNGYVLFIEGGLIDYANHATLAQKAVIETVEFDEAVKMADLKTSETDTLIVVTSDHSHTMTIAGYPHRGDNILGKISSLNEGVSPDVADRYDNKSVTTISYAYGPGYFYNHDSNGKRIDLDSVTIDKNFEYITSVGSNDEPHGGDDVGIFSRGPFAHLLSGVVEQNYIPHVCAYAACLGSKGTPNRCEE